MTEVQLGSAGTAFVELNDLEGPVMILAGSLGSDRQMWSGWLKSLCSQRKVVIVEWPGHGVGQVTRPFTVDDLADDLYAYVHSLPTTEVSYCGLSLGGAVGQAFISRYPGMLQNVVLVACGLTFATPEALVERSLSVCRGGLASLAKASHTRWFAQPGKGADDAMRRTHVGHLGAMEPLGYALNCLALAAFDGANYDYSGRDRVLVIGGAQDAAVPVDDVRRVADTVGSEQCVIVEDAGHLVNVDQPERFAAIVHNFLRSEPTRGDGRPQSSSRRPAAPEPEHFAQSGPPAG